MEGYELVLIPCLPTKQEDERGVEVGDILALKFVKSALSVNPCMVSVTIDRRMKVDEVLKYSEIFNILYTMYIDTYLASYSSMKQRK